MDKTELISELLNSWGKVNLFTRPRRFGKSLNMSMLKYFFEYGCESRIFDGLEISREKEKCEKYMGKFPVISVTLKGLDSDSYETARDMLGSVVGREALRFQFLTESRQLSDMEKAQYAQLINVDPSARQGFIMSEDILRNSLRTLSELLCKHYGQKVILLIDEYDVPLDKARQFGYYDEMCNLIRGLLGEAMKSNDSLYFAVLTGCLRVAKESIFTGLNNFKIMSVMDARFDTCFGFTDGEVLDMLRYYGFEDRYEKIKEWYDGYHFGNADVYCPWDVINYVDLLCSEAKAKSRAFWINTSGNEIIRRFLGMATPKTGREVEKLINGESIAKKVDQDLTYRDLYSSIDNMWSVLLMTGYLTGQRNIGDEEEDETGNERYSLEIPNREIRVIFIRQIAEWFQEQARKDTPRLDAFCNAFPKGDAMSVEAEFNAYLKKTISVRDTSVRKDKKENLPTGKAITKGSKGQNPSACFYHGILLGLLSHREDWDIDSNAESGEGYSDILIEIEEELTGIVIEVKYPNDGDLETGCREALQQIVDKGYETKLWQDGMTNIIKYGIACKKKSCMVRKGE